MRHRINSVLARTTLRNIFRFVPLPRCGGTDLSESAFPRQGRGAGIMAGGRQGRHGQRICHLWIAALELEVFDGRQLHTGAEVEAPAAQPCAPTAAL